MPLYVYSCGTCGAGFEAIRPIELRESANCPQCFQMAPRNELAEGPALVKFKGKGWQTKAPIPGGGWADRSK